MGNAYSYVMGQPKPPAISRKSFKEAAVFQIYPASFKDSNGDGLGDIPGIISELDYIKKLGVDIVWLSPVLKSPWVDNGYDISDYRNIHAPFGTMADHDALIKGLHERGLKYVLDLVVNHTSSEHEWFKESKKSKDNSYRDWYFWKPARYDDKGNRIPPNNWESYFGGSAWEWDEATEEYYLHLFATGQPDLNWENPKVVEAVHDIMRFWLDRGVDGFRMDVINLISKPPGLPDAPIERPDRFLQWGTSIYACGPRMHEFFKGMGVILKQYDAFTVGEMPGVTDVTEIVKAVGGDRGELNMAFQFEIMGLDEDRDNKWVHRDWKLGELKTIINKWNKFMIDNNGWNALYVENHDQGRSISRFASDDPKWRTLSSKMLATNLAFQSGTVFVFQGQDLGQINLPRSWGLDKYRDLETLNYWRDFIRQYPDDVQLQKQRLEQIRLVSRDNARTPMQWTSAPQAGFTDEGVTPWMDVHPDYAEWNVAKQKDDPSSPFSYWCGALALRKSLKDIFIYGDFALVDEPHPNIFSYVRTYDADTAALVVTNFSDQEVPWKVPAQEAKIFDKAKAMLKSYDDAPVRLEGGLILVRPYEAFVLVVNK